MNRTAAIIGAYALVGFAVAVWTVSRIENGKPSFTGFAETDSNAKTLALCVAAWPLVVVKNLKAGA
jgi:hypothetical protein